MMIAVAGAVPVLAVTVAVFVWLTVPPAPDPDALPSHAAAPPSADYRDAIDEGSTIARTLVAGEKLPGLSLAVSMDGEIVWAEGFRFANMERESPVTPETRFRIGAISETITAAAVGRLLERDRIDLDAPVQRYVPSFPEKQWPITTRQLMAHAAGLPALSGEGGPLRHTTCDGDADRLSLFADDPLRFRPGTELSRSAFGWVLVGAAVAGAAEEPYLDFVQREVLTPLGMTSTGPDVAGAPERATAHFYYPRLMLDPRYGVHDAPAVDLSCILPAGGFLSTPSDLVRLGVAMMRAGLLEPATLETLQTAVSLSSGEATGQALGWTVDTIPIGPEGVPARILGHGLGEPVDRYPLSASVASGDVPGSTASLAILPEHAVAIAVVSNVSGAESVPELTHRLAELFVRARSFPPPRPGAD